MIRRSRLNVQPNLRPECRAQIFFQDGLPSEECTANFQTQSTAGDQSAEFNTCAMPRCTHHSQPETTSSDLDGKGSRDVVSGGSNPTISSCQRRKRFYAMPNVTKPRVKTPKSPPLKTVPVSPVDAPAPISIDQTQLLNSAAPGVRASSGAKPSKTECKSGPLSLAVLEPVFPSGNKAKDKSPAVQKSSQEAVFSEGRKLPEPSLVHVKLSLGNLPIVKTPPPASTLLLRAHGVSPERILKAQKLRELLKKKRRREMKQKKGKCYFTEDRIPQDQNKMIMSDFIYYLPETNPMKSYQAEEPKQIEKVGTPSSRKESCEGPREAGQEDTVEHRGDELTQDQLIVPRVKVADDGTLIIDEESLTVEVLRVKGCQMMEENDPIFEQGSSTTYSSFRRTNYTKPWSNRETDMFFLAISMVGTDFSMIGQLFPHRARTEIKNKFKKEERRNAWRLDKAFREKRRFDIEAFNKLLERTLAEEKKKRPSRTKGSAGKMIARKLMGKQKDNKAVIAGAPEDQTAEKKLDVEMTEGDSETAEKENEDCSNVSEAMDEVTVAQRKHKKDWDMETSPEKPANQRKVEGSGSSMPDEGSVDDNSSAVSSAQSLTAGVMSRTKGPDSSVEGQKKPVIKSVQLSRSCLSRSLPKLGRRWEKINSELRKKDREEGNMDDISLKAGSGNGASVGKKTKRGKSPSSCVSSDEGDDEPDITVVQEQMLNKPTRSRRIPKFSQQLQQAGQDDLPMESPPTSPALREDGPLKRQGMVPLRLGKKAQPKPRPNLAVSQRNRQGGKSKLVTLRASVPEDSEEQGLDEGRPEEMYSYPINPEEQNQVPAFVPLGLRYPEPVTMEVEETVEELEILVNVPDVLDPAESGHALCSPPVCLGAQEEVVVPPEHALSSQPVCQGAQEELVVPPQHALCSQPVCLGAQEEVVVPPEHALSSQPVCQGAQEELVVPPQHALCSQPVCQEVVTEHQLDLLVDVIEFLSPGHVEDSEDTFNEAARTLLTIRNPELFSRASPTCRTAETTDTEDSPCWAGVEREEEIRPELQLTSSPVTLELPVDGSTKSLEQSVSLADTVSVTQLAVAEVSLKTSSSAPSAEALSQPKGMAAPRNRGDTLDGTVGLTSSMVVVPPFRRNRFPKLRPNLGCAARLSRIHPIEGAIIAAIKKVPLESYDKGQGELDCVTMERASKKCRYEEAAMKKTLDVASHVGRSQEGVPSSVTSGQIVQSSRRTWFPPPRPNLERAARNPHVLMTHSSTTMQTVERDGGNFPEGSGPLKPTEEESLGRSFLITENGNKTDDETFTETNGTEEEAKITIPVVETQMGKTTGKTRSQTTFPGRKLAAVAEKEVTSVHYEEDLSGKATKGALDTTDLPCPEPTFILTLFQIPPPALGEYAPCSSPAVTDVLLSPLVLVDAPSQCEPQSDGHPQTVGEVRVGCSGSQFLVSDPLVPVLVDQRVETCDVEEVELGKPVLPTSAQTSLLAQTPVSGATGRQSYTQQPTVPQTELPKSAVGHSHLLQMEMDERSGHVRVEAEARHHITPLALAGPMTRPGRKPRGFLSFMSNKSAPGSNSGPRTARPMSRKPQVNTLRRERKKTVTPPTGSPSSSIKEVCP